MISVFRDSENPYWKSFRDIKNGENHLLSIEININCAEFDYIV